MFLIWKRLRRQTRAAEVGKAREEGVANLRSPRTARSAKEKLPRIGSVFAFPSQLPRGHL